MATRGGLGGYYRTLFEENPLPMWIFDIDSLFFLAANKAVQSLYGYSEEEFLQMTLTQIRPPEEVPRFLEVIQSLPSTPIQSNNWKHFRKDGTLIEVDVSSWEIDFRNRRARLSVIHDVTEKRNAERKIAQSESKWRSLVQNAPNIIIILDASGTVQFINRKFAAYENEDIRQKCIFDFLFPKEAIKLKALLERVIVSGKPEAFEMPVEGAFGGIAWYKCNVGADFQDRKADSVMMIMTDITDHRFVEEALQDTQVRFLLVSKATNDAIWDWDLRTGNVWWNENVCSLFGYTPDDVRGNAQWRYDHIHPEDLLQMKSSIESVIAGETEFWSAEYRFRRADGSYASILDRGYAIRRGGDAVRMLGAMMDISERKQAEKLNAALYRIADEAGAAEDMQQFYIAMHQIVAELMYAPNFFIALYDEESDSISFPYFVDEKDITVREPQKAKKGLTGYILRTGQPLLLASSAANELEASGQVAPVGHPSVGWLGVPLKDGDKTFGVLVVQSYDEGVNYSEKDKELLVFVSQHVATALLRKRSGEAIRKSEELYRTFFESSKDAIFITTPHGEILEMNPAGLELFGYRSKEEIMKGDVIRDHYVDIADRTRFRSAIEQNGYVKDFELTLRKKNGNKFSVLETATAVRDETGKTIAYRGILRDVTHLKELEDKLRQAQKMEAIGQLAGGVAHDFNNTLMAITGYCELLQMKLPSIDPRNRDVLEILKATERGAALTRQLLAFSRKQVLEATVIDLNQVLENIEGMLVRLIGEDIDLNLRFDPLLQAVKADPGQIEQVIMNLAVNARDAMPGGGRLTIETQNATLTEKYFEQPPGAYVMLSVSDTGAGMDPETLSHIFEPFFTTKEKGKGTGLGLATVYGIVKQSGGFIWPNSDKGHGSTFRIYLPSVRERFAEQPMPSIRQRETGKGETILLVDDNESVRNSLADLLRMHGYNVISAADGFQALDASRQRAGAIDLLITDVVMPQMNGRELADMMMSENEKMKVLFISGYDERAVSDGGRVDRKIAFLAKPASTDSLLLKIRQLI